MFSQHYCYAEICTLKQATLIQALKPFEERCGCCKWNPSNVEILRILDKEEKLIITQMKIFQPHFFLLKTTTAVLISDGKITIRSDYLEISIDNFVLLQVFKSLILS